MPESKQLSPGTALLLALTIVLGAVGDLLLGVGMKHVGTIETGSVMVMMRAASRAITRVEIWLGIAVLSILFACSLILFSKIDYSYAQPASAVGYALVALLGYMVLGEAVTATRWAGIGFICAGVALVGRTPPRTTLLPCELPCSSRS
jgi:multidrug transporter EmrE-like cation transporter